MKNRISSYLLVILLGIVILSSCETEEVNTISFNKDAYNLNVGLTDTLLTTIALTGDINNFPIRWLSSDSTVVSIINDSLVSTSIAGSNVTIKKIIIFKALKVGSATVTIQVDGKTHSCGVTVSQRSYTFTKAIASNWGDYYDTQTNNFDLYLLENSLITGDDGKISGNGNMLYLDFYLPITQNSLSSGNFTLSTEGESNTFYPGEVYENDGQYFVVGSRLIKIENSNSANIELAVDGEFSISKSGSNFTIQGELVLDNEEVIAFKFNGAVTEQDLREKPVDVNPDLIKGFLLNYGDAYKSGTTNNFVTYLGSESVNFADSVWTGDVLMIEFNSALSVKDYIPEGTYRVMTELTYSQLVPFSIVLGYTGTGGTNWGTWYFGNSGKQTKKINAGKMDVSRTDDIYNIQFEFFDKIGSSIRGTYNGKLSYINATQSVSGAPVAKVRGTQPSFSSGSNRKLDVTKKRTQKYEFTNLNSKFLKIQ